MLATPEKQREPDLQKDLTVRQIAKADGWNRLRGSKTAIDITATFGLIAACIAGVVLTPYFLIVNVLVMPPLIMRLFSMGHEASHALISRNRTFNDFIGLIAHGAILMPFYGWRAGHLSHHMNNDHPTKEEYGPASALKLFELRSAKSNQTNDQATIKTALIKLARLSWKNVLYDLGFWRSHTARKGILRRHFKDKRAEVLNIVFPALFWTLYVVLTILYPLYALAGIWIPMVLGHSLIGILGFLNHQDVENRVSFRFESTKEAAAHETIDVDYGPLNWFTMGIGDEHTMHHMLPQVPWYNLRKLRKNAEDHGCRIDRRKAPAKAWTVMWNILQAQYHVQRVKDGYKVIRSRKHQPAE
ncbi:fatty acid desaturase [Roseibium sp. RKSG952]|uniref:fatty acid desaturase family protein n=1 Tax=Roseibium sp. RKSG952 TaxID=2529384 RepID=UPI0012BB856F|nr:fatty acid desaturase [Roseibium sp. RKSG952]MTH97432.1 hypothetical protein [Roseibium sp. RKSG952]